MTLPRVKAGRQAATGQKHSSEFIDPGPSRGSLLGLGAPCLPSHEPRLNLDNASLSPPPLTVGDVEDKGVQLISRNPDVTMWNLLDAGLPELRSRLASMADCNCSASIHQVPRLANIQPRQECYARTRELALGGK